MYCFIQTDIFTLLVLALAPFGLLEEPVIFGNIHRISYLNKSKEYNSQNVTITTPTKTAVQTNQYTIMIIFHLKNSDRKVICFQF